MSDIPDFADQCFFGSVNFVSHKPFIVLVSFIYISSLIALNCSFQDVHVLTIFRPHLIAITHDVCETHKIHESYKYSNTLQKKLM